MECKDDMWGGDGFSLICINRNIVECKVKTYICTSAGTSVVLIETLWNVKVDIAINHDPDAILY